MKQFNTITGLSRVGSTLLCNILNQNPENHATDTGLLTGVIENIMLGVSNAGSFPAHLHRDPKYHDKIVRATRSFIMSYHRDHKGVVFDKDKGWSHMSLVFPLLFPKGQQIVIVRDLPDVFASMEKNHRKNPMFIPSSVISSTNLQLRAANAISIEGTIGNAVMGIMDLVHRKSPNVTFIGYESFVSNPQLALKKIYKRCGIKKFDHKFIDVKNVSNELDVLYGNKFPHNGEGDVEDSKIGCHKDILDDETVRLIRKADHFKEYNEVFKYA